MFQLHEQVQLSPEGEAVVDASASEYGTGYINEIAEATGVPCSGNLYGVTWYYGYYLATGHRRTIFRENELEAAKGDGEH